MRSRFLDVREGGDWVNHQAVRVRVAYNRHFVQQSADRILQHQIARSPRFF
jgi:hypothetical protein